MNVQESEHNSQNMDLIKNDQHAEAENGKSLFK